LAGGVNAPSILIRCDGGASLGMGHVSRCLALAAELRDVYGRRVVFAMRGADSAGAASVRASGYAVEPIVAREDADYGSALLAFAEDLRGDVQSWNSSPRLAGCTAVQHRLAALVVDVRDALSRSSLEAVRASGVRVVTIDDGSDRRLASDLVFYPPVPQVDEMDWTGFSGQRFAGWEWVLLKREFAADAVGRVVRASVGAGWRAAAAVQAIDSGSQPSLAARGVSPAGTPLATDVLVTMGGSDPAGMTEFVLDALNLLPPSLAVHVIVGPAFDRASALAAAVGRSNHAVRVSRGPETMAPLMRASRVAIASIGVSAYELAACGVPAVHLCLTADHARSSLAFQDARIALSLGVFATLQPPRLAEAVAGLLGDPLRRADMAARARALVDGLGAARVARLIMAACADGKDAWRGKQL
jgi:spore coat polysaccharide biosynthesis protein SpsF